MNFGTTHSDGNISVTLPARERERFINSFYEGNGSKEDYLKFTGKLERYFEKLNTQICASAEGFNSDGGFIHPNTQKRIAEGKLSVDISSNAVVGDIEIADGVTIKNAVVADGVRLDRGVYLEDGAVVCADCHLGPDVSIGGGTVLDEQNLLGKGCITIGNHCYIGKQNVFHGAKVVVDSRSFIGNRNFIDSAVKIDECAVIMDDNILLESAQLERQASLANRNLINANFSMKNFSNPQDNTIVLDDERKLEVNEEPALPKLDVAPRSSSKSGPHAVGKKAFANLTPAKIKAYLDKHVIGQEEAKKMLSVAGFYYLQSVQGKRINRKVDLPKTNIMLIGDTGCGKTLLAKSLAKIMDIPFTMTDASVITEAGYKGDDVEGILEPFTHLIEENDEYDEGGNSKFNGIVFVDEFDKIFKKAQNWGSAIQNEFLKLIEGTLSSVPKGRRDKGGWGSERCVIDTNNILFIFAGSFPGLHRIINKRIGNPHDAAFEKEQNSEELNKLHSNQLLKQLTNDDLYEYGIYREFLGRVPIINVLEPLERDALIDIFSKPENSIYNQYKERLNMLGVGLKFTKDAIVQIVDSCLEKKTGARSLGALTATVMNPVLYYLPDQPNVDHIVVDDVAVAERDPWLVFTDKNKCRLTELVGDKVKEFQGEDFNIKVINR